MHSAHALQLDPGDDPRVLLELEVPSDITLIEQVVALVSHQSRELGFPAHACTFAIPVALAEALSNAMLRGNRDDRAKHVGVRASIQGPNLVLDITDEGDAFDLDRCTRDPTTTENRSREDGRGLFLMRRLMDRVERFPRRVPGNAESAGPGIRTGNLVRLTLRRR